MADQPITRRNFLRQAPLASMAVSIPFLAESPKEEMTADEQSAFIIGGWVMMTPFQKAETAKRLRQEGLGEFADALSRIRVT